MKRPYSALALFLTALLTGCTEQNPPSRVVAETSPQPTADPGTGSASLDHPNQVVIPPDSPQLSQIRVEPVATAEVPAGELASPGKVEANPNRTSHVTLPVSGRVTTVKAKIGDYVKQGSSLLTIESPEVDLAISSYLQAQAALTQAHSSETKARADLDRSKDLFEHSAVAQKEVLNADALLAQAGASVEQAKASLEQSQRKLALLGVRPGQFGQQVSVLAPISGKVIEMSVVPGEFRNDLSQPLITIADLSSVWVTSDVPESSIRLVSIGEKLDIELTAYPGETFRGRVTQIADSVDPQTRTIKVRAEMTNPGGRLRPEMFGRMLLRDQVRQTPVIPTTAVVQAADQNVVWQELQPGRFQQVKVKLGPIIGDRVAVAEGLKPADRIVTDGVMLLRLK
jgi:cobalt-zinc-cadmium efflux system membrane fusion protein